METNFNYENTVEEIKRRAYQSTREAEKDNQIKTLIKILYSKDEELNYWKRQYEKLVKENNTLTKKYLKAIDL